MSLLFCYVVAQPDIIQRFYIFTQSHGSLPAGKGENLVKLTPGLRVRCLNLCEALDIILGCRLMADVSLGFF